MISYKLVLLPFISAFIGWLFSWIAVKMLLGQLVKNQRKIAVQIGTAAYDLIDLSQLTATIKDPKNLATVKPNIEHHVEVFLNVKLKEKLPVLSMYVGPSTLDKIKEGLLEEIDLLLPEVIGGYADNLSSNINVGKIVTDKIGAIQPEMLEALLTENLKKQFGQVQMIGALLGLVIGLVQLLLSIL